MKAYPFLRNVGQSIAVPVIMPCYPRRIGYGNSPLRALWSPGRTHFCVDRRNKRTYFCDNALSDLGNAPPYPFLRRTRFCETALRRPASTDAYLFLRASRARAAARAYPILRENLRLKSTVVKRSDRTLVRIRKAGTHFLRIPKEEKQDVPYQFLRNNEVYVEPYTALATGASAPPVPVSA